MTSPTIITLARRSLMAATLALAAPAVAQERPLDVQIDQATRVQLRAPAGSVIVARAWAAFLRRLSSTCSISVAAQTTRAGLSG